MRSIKMLGLAAFAALMAMAFLGASSAMAGNTQLCMSDESPCAEANVIAHVHEETVSGAPATLLSSLGNVTCDALFLGLTLGLGAPLVIHGNFTYTNCLRNGKKCTVEEEEGKSSLIAVLRTSAEIAVLAGAGEVNVHCGLFINCNYDGEGLVGTHTGPLLTGGTGESATSEATLHHVGGVCPETGKLDIRMVPLLATYIST
jgi:hypothetical protein